MTIERGDNLGPALPDPEPEPEQSEPSDPLWRSSIVAATSLSVIGASYSIHNQLEPPDPFDLGIGATIGAGS